MNSFQRIMTTVGHKEPDKVPLFLSLSLYGAKELNLSIKEYFSKPENIVNAQLKMVKKYKNDCVYTFSYAPVEIEAFGGEVIFTEEGPPNSGEPFIKTFDQISNLHLPDIKSTDCLSRVLKATYMLKKAVNTEIPIIGVVMSPFSIPVMQMGFEKYLELIYFRPHDFDKLMKINEEFCVTWANAQLEAGADIICYFDPFASPTIIERDKYLSTGYKVAKSTISRIKGAVVTHLASGIALPVLDDIICTGSLGLGFSAKDDLKKIKKSSQNKICLVGNLNAVEMPHWDSKKIQSEIKNIIMNAASGGGLILSDNHGEIPWQVPETVLLEISEAVQQFGRYPIKEKQ